MTGIELTLNLLVALSTLGALVAAQVTPRIQAAIKVEFGTAGVVTLALTGLVNKVLWVIVAVQLDHWQFAAIPLLGWLVTYASGVSSRANAKVAQR